VANVRSSFFAVHQKQLAESNSGIPVDRGMHPITYKEQGTQKASCLFAYQSANAAPCWDKKRRKPVKNGKEST
jgi:hypothetical protein